MIRYVLCLLLPLLHAAPLAAEKHRVLILNSYHPGYVWSDGILKGIAASFEEAVKADGRFDYEFHIEFMDTKRHPPAAVLPRFQELLVEKDQGLRFDVVITSDNTAFDFALSRRDRLFPGVPVVFCGVNNFKDSLITGQDDITGVVEDADLRGTLEMALELHPGTQHVYVISDHVLTGQAAEARLRALVPEFADRVSFRFLSNLTGDELAAALRSLEPDGIVFLSSFFRDRNEVFFSEVDGRRLVVRNSPVPVYTSWDHYFGDGVMGGVLLSGVQQGRAAGRAAVRILRGEPAGAIEILRQSPNVIMFDYEQLQRFGVDESTLPAGSIVTHRPPPSFYARYTGRIWVVIGVFVALCIVVAVLALNIVVRRRAEEASRESEENLRITLNSIGDAVIATDAGGLVTRMNPVAEAMTGWRGSAAFGRPLADVFSLIDADTRERVPAPRVPRQGRTVDTSARILLVSADERERLIAYSIAPIRDQSRQVLGTVLVFRDISEESMLQDQLRHSQKMEAIGQLAGGVAHDFNNLLTGIMGSIELLQSEVEEDSRASRLASDVMHAAARAADLTRQLLAFSRKGKLRNVPVNIHGIIDDTMRLLSRSIDRRIDVSRSFGARRFIVLGDPSELQSAILNLGLNARDAMPEGGQLTFWTSNREVTVEDTISADLAPGLYLEVIVRDSGKGMDEETRKRVFDPFFTTKDAGEGTGLGLAGVYGCVRSHQGTVDVRTRLGLGSDFRILLPTCHASTVRHPATSHHDLVDGQGHVLIVDDEDLIRDFASQVLRRLGYTVSTCADGRKAVELYGSEGGNIDMVVLDLNLPRLSGEEVLNRLLKIDPDVRVLVVSGFSESLCRDTLSRAGVVGFLKKPFQGTELAREVARHLRVRSST